ncbi:heat stress transcription factor [Musa troglodytarum]|uniref:Heat stress transcription factor n=1 Tax=Musa troglodytarum TaxID=320322 RepID=A0A9E7HJ52_9LILI|nr:heat stress transcription factor [Musa troglodytarum]
MLAIRYVLRDAMADFSILYRIRSLRSLLKFLRSSVGSDDSIRLFLRSPTIPELRVC